jgi:hypothetical protein
MPATQINTPTNNFVVHSFTYSNKAEAATEPVIKVQVATQA